MEKLYEHRILIYNIGTVLKYTGICALIYLSLSLADGTNPTIRIMRNTIRVLIIIWFAAYCIKST